MTPDQREEELRRIYQNLDSLSGLVLDATRKQDRYALSVEISRIKFKLATVLDDMTDEAIARAG